MAPVGPLHPLPIPDGRGDSVAVDFVCPLPEDHGYNMLVTMTDRLGADIRLVPCRGSITLCNSQRYFSTTGTARMGCLRRLFQIVTSCSCPASGRAYTNLLV